MTRAIGCLLSVIAAVAFLAGAFLAANYPKEEPS